MQVAAHVRCAGLCMLQPFAAEGCMSFDWSTLGARDPATLVRPRVLAHNAAQWPSKAARANLPAVPDDSHASLQWEAQQGTLWSQPLPVDGRSVRIGVRVAAYDLLIMRDGIVLDTYPLEGRKESMIAVWFDSALRALGLKPAAQLVLPYTVHHAAPRSFGRGSDAEGFAEVARWFDASADLFEQVRAKVAGTGTAAGTLICWPHHFDIATLIAFGEGNSDNGKSIGVGLSPGDEHYAQPYVYISPWPRLATNDLPLLPAPGHWHTHGFVGAIATAEQILALTEREAGLRAFIEAALDAGRARLGV